MSNIAKFEQQTGIGALSEPQLLVVLKSSLYPGAADDSIRMVLSYCQAAKLDPMQKPVHIVPMWDSKSGGMRDVIMPGVGLYRTQAARTGEYAGVSEPEYGPDITENIGGVEVTYPAWCRVTVKRKLADGTVADFSAVERWKENYAVKGGKEKSIAPNAMWMKRPYGQIAKCAEAQALRKAFPEVGAQPTADEMEGKSLDERDMGPAQVVRDEPKKLPDYTAAQFSANLPAWSASIAAGNATADRIIAMVSTKYTLSDEQKSAIRNISMEAENENS